jgi:hypothetical protein
MWCYDTITAAFRYLTWTTGQTGSGKTYTMMGSNFAAEAGQFCPISGQLIPAKKTTLAEIRSALPREEDGIIPRMLHQMFQSIDELRTKYEFLIRASFIEVYNEQVRDLLRPTNHSLKLREDNKQVITPPKKS